jgi:hypothetical protein
MVPEVRESKETQKEEDAKWESLRFPKNRRGD